MFLRATVSEKHPPIKLLRTATNQADRQQLIGNMRQTVCPYRQEYRYNRRREPFKWASLTKQILETIILLFARKVKQKKEIADAIRS